MSIGGEASGETRLAAELDLTQLGEAELRERVGEQMQLVSMYEGQLPTAKAEAEAANERWRVLREGCDIARQSRDELQAEASRRAEAEPTEVTIWIPGEGDI